MGAGSLDLAKESLSELLQDERVPVDVRNSLAADYQEVEDMLARLQTSQLHIAVFGRVSVGKSALLNALLGENRFSTSPLHGETREAAKGHWQQYQSGNLYLIDTPGINEVGGEQREQLAHQVASRAELVLFVVDGDLTETERHALRQIVSEHRPVILVLNKADRYSPQEKQELLQSLQRHAQGLVEPAHIILASAAPPPQTVIRLDEFGQEQESVRERGPDVAELKKIIWDIMEAEGETLAALNATLFAGNLADQVGQRIIQARSKLAQKIIHSYAAGKGVAVALNPVPVADLLAAVGMDAAMILHLSRLFGLPLSSNEAGSLLKTITGAMLAMTGTVWLIHFGSSALKTVTGGLSTTVTAGVQGGVAYYSTMVVGEAALRYLAAGKSWGEGGPKYVLRQILDSLDKDSIIQQAKDEILQRLSTARS